MGVSLISQASEFALASLLGAGLGFVYDCMRIMRGRIPLRGITAVLDLLFWAVCAGAAFWFAMSAGGGELRIFAAVAIALGIAAYFSLLSGFVRAVGFVIADGIIELFRVIFRPVFAVLKIICEFFVKTFAFFEKWRIMELARMKRKDGTNEKEKGNHTHSGNDGYGTNDRHRANLHGVRRPGDSQQLGAVRKKKGRNRRNASQSGGAEDSQRRSGRGYRV
jgi:spore cortex biosynthesis protein YabQ